MQLDGIRKSLSFNLPDGDYLLDRYCGLVHYSACGWQGMLVRSLVK
jgi:hypothetical protein